MHWKSCLRTGDYSTLTTPRSTRSPASELSRRPDAELERLLALGARPVDIGQTGTENWHVLADPEGNEFCLLRARLQPLSGAAD
ncbi:hypothetical protein GCM10010507_38410 [Streptomyces cinnamoneus]|uniref:Glyoxalase-like domain-containing protein n=1 Tax=Streptomyces cinnamoneus TaxID=53446 RepID=A0A918WLZ6_STRCJ|nr:hypothetical protein GCM10010507_38410 [Streptomyces cinnamoneus]